MLAVTGPKRPKTIRELVARHHSLVFRVAHAIVGNAADAEDVAQSVFLGISRNPSQLDRMVHPAAWLARASANAAKNFIRGESNRRRREQAWAEKQLADKTEGERVETRESVRRAVEELPEALRLTVILHYHEGLSYRAIAGALEVPEGTVGRRLSDARQKLRSVLSARGISVGGAALVATLPASAVPIPAGLEGRITKAVTNSATASTLESGVSTQAPLRVLPAVALKLGLPAVLITLVVTGGWLLFGPPSENRDLEPNRVLSDSPNAPANETASHNPSVAPEDPMPGQNLPDRQEPVARIADGPAIHGWITAAESLAVSGVSVRLVKMPSGEVAATTETNSTGYYEFHTLPIPWSGEESSFEAAGATSSAVAAQGAASGSKLQPQVERATNTRTQRHVPPQSMAIIDDALAVEVVAAGYRPAQSDSLSKEDFDSAPSHRLDLDLAPGRRLAGRILDSFGRPVADATVRVVGYIDEELLSNRALEARCGNDGNFALDSLPDGPWIIKALAPLHASREIVASDSTVFQEIVMESAARLTVLVPEARDGEQVRLRCADGQSLNTVLDADKTAVFDGVAFGQHSVELHTGFYDSVPLARQPVTLAAPETTINLTRSAVGTIQGRVEWADDAPTGLQQIVLFPADAGESKGRLSTMLDNTGRFGFVGVPADDYHLLLIDLAKGRETLVFAAQTVTVEAAKTASLTVRPDLDEFGELVVDVREQSGPVDRAFITCRRTEPDFFLGNTRSDESGRGVRALYPGRYTVVVSRRGYAPHAPLTVDIRDREQRRISVVLTPEENLIAGRRAVASVFPWDGTITWIDSTVSVGSYLQFLEAASDGRITIDREVLTGKLPGQAISIANGMPVATGLTEVLEKFRLTARSRPGGLRVAKRR